MARTAAVVVPIAIALLELGHPGWTDGSVAVAVTAAGAWWVALHALLVGGYGALAVVLCRASSWRAARVLVLIFGACNTAYLAVDGLVVWTLAQTDPAIADGVWNSLLVTVLADVTGATWAAALLLVAWSANPVGPGRAQAAGGGRVAAAGLAVTWLAFLATVPPLSATQALSRIAALATGAWAVYQDGPSRVPFALLVFAAVLRQHVGPEAALGLLCVALALALPPALRGR